MFEWLDNKILARGDEDNWSRFIGLAVVFAIWAISKLVKTVQDKSGKTPSQTPARPQTASPSPAQRSEDESPREQYDREVTAAREHFDAVLEKIRDYKEKLDNAQIDDAQRKEVLYKIEQARAGAYREFENARAKSREKMEAALGRTPAAAQRPPMVERPTVARPPSEEQVLRKRREDVARTKSDQRQTAIRQGQENRSRQMAERQAARLEIQRQAQLRRAPHSSAGAIQKESGDTMVRRSPKEAFAASDAAHGLTKQTSHAAAQQTAHTELVFDEAFSAGSLRGMNIGLAVIYAELLAPPLALRD